MSRAHVPALLMTWAVCSTAHAETTAFYYGASVPSELLSVYDQVVVEPSHFAGAQALSDAKAVPVAYVSLGEVGDAAGSAIDPSWVLARNAAWSTRVMDLTQPGYRAYVLRRVDALWQQGYRRFFFDTLDSYELGTREPRAREAQRLALCSLIRSLSVAHPQARILINRGFALLPQISSLVHGVVAESLFDGWDAEHAQYRPVAEADRAWLVARLREVRERYQLPVTIIDYRPEAERAEARSTAQRIAQLGFMPWVCNASLTSLGVGAYEIFPRRVLILSEASGAQLQPGVARWLAPVLEYLGYVPEYRALSDGLPDYPLYGRYAGVISTFQSAQVSNLMGDYGTWLSAQIKAGVRVVVFGSLGLALDGPVARELGVQPLAAARPGQPQPSAADFVTRDTLIGFEAQPPAHGFEGAPVALADAEPQLELRLRTGEIATAIAVTRWGGVAFSHAFALRGLHGERAWVVNPFAFLTRALALPAVPVPDLTTESGGRVALFVIDAQGAAEQARLRGRPLVSSALAQLLAAQPWPHALTLDDASSADLEACAALSESGAYAAHMRAGRTASRGVGRLLTSLEPLYVEGDKDPIPAPIAPDLSYYEGSSEAYALRRVIETYEYTDAPRRLRPIALHYHAYAAGSPGGQGALSDVYSWLSERPIFAVRVADYRARIAAFREQVIAQQLDGAFLSFGGAALRTLRIPGSLGPLDLEHSAGVAALATLPQGRYATFAAQGERLLRFGERAHVRPHLEQINGRVEHFTWKSLGPRQVQVELHALAQEPLMLRIAGLPQQARCNLVWSDGSQELRTDAQGRSIVSLPAAVSGTISLSCGPGGRDG